MAISILNTTFTAEKVQTDSTAIAIPATTAGSTLIVCVVWRTPNTSSNFMDHVVDDGQFFPDYAVAFSNSFSGTTRQGMNCFYRQNVQAGISNVYAVVNSGSQAIRYRVAVYEVSGINAITPFESGNTTGLVTFNSTSKTGTAISTAYTNALYISITWKGNPSGLTAGGGFTSDSSSNFTTDTAYMFAHKVASGSNAMTVTYANQTTSGVIGLASFDPNPNAWTVGLTEDIGTADSLDNEAAFAKIVTEIINLADAVALSLTTLDHFKSLFDTITLGLTLALQMSYSRFMIDVVTLDDTLILVKDVFRTLSEELRLQDWLSVKKINSSNWGS